MAAISKSRLLGVSAALGICLLCSGLSVRQVVPPSYKSPDAWLEAKPACVFPLSAQSPPNSQDAFTAALLGGLRQLAITPAGATLLTTHAIAFPQLQTLRIDLTGATIDDTHKPPKVNWHFLPRPGIRVQRIEVTAQPLLIEGAKVQYSLTAEDADLKMAEDRARHPLLMLTAAEDGHFALTAAHADVQTLCLAAAKQFAHKYGFSVSDLIVELTTATPRTLDVKVTVTLGGVMYGKLDLTGRFAVAGDLTATASHLSCRGQGPGGVLISSLLTPGLMYYDGKTKPLLSFPFGGMQLRDVKFHTDAALHIDADFGKRS